MGLCAAFWSICTRKKITPYRHSNILYIGAHIRIKYALDQLGDPMTLLINLVFDNGDFPEIWADGLICPIHKKDSKNIADNYRKITVMLVLGKIFESALNSRLSFRNIVLKKEDNMHLSNL